MQTALFALIGTSEAIIIGIVFLVLFGAKKVPELMKGLGQGMREFKKASREVQEELERAGRDTEPTPPTTPRRPADSVPQNPMSEVQPSAGHTVEPHPPVGSAKA